MLFTTPLLLIFSDNIKLGNFGVFLFFVAARKIRSKTSLCNPCLFVKKTLFISELVVSISNVLSSGYQCWPCLELLNVVGEILFCGV